MDFKKLLKAKYVLAGDNRTLCSRRQENSHLLQSLFFFLIEHMQGGLGEVCLGTWRNLLCREDLERRRTQEWQRSPIIPKR